MKKKSTKKKISIVKDVKGPIGFEDLSAGESKQAVGDTIARTIRPKTVIAPAKFFVAPKSKKRKINEAAKLWGKGR